MDKIVLNIALIGPVITSNPPRSCYFRIQNIWMDYMSTVRVTAALLFNFIYSTTIFLIEVLTDYN